jgi:hypothetical protein
LVSLASLAGCAVGSDTSSIPRDAALGFDAGSQRFDASAGLGDSSAQDAGPSYDASVADGGAAVDGAWGVPMGYEGGPCVRTDGGQTPACADPADVCFDWSTPHALNPISSCIRPCTHDADCASSPSGHLCAAVRWDMKACVDHSVGLGEKIELSLRNADVLTGCAAPYVAVPPSAGSRLLALADDEASCGLRCAQSADCPLAVPYCSLGATTSTGARNGLCQVRRAERGARCSRSRATAMCETARSPNMACIDLGLSDGDASMSAATEGNCVELCTSSSPTCVPGDLGQRPTCSFGFFASQTLGVCSDQCTPFPDGCLGPGSPPVAGETAAGMNCFAFGANPAMPSALLCIDISQRNNLLHPWDFQSTPMVCESEELRCPHGTQCAEIMGPNGTPSSACLYGCSTRTASITCARAGLASCQVDPSGIGGFCSP